MKAESVTAHQCSCTGVGAWQSWELRPHSIPVNGAVSAGL